MAEPQPDAIHARLVLLCGDIAGITTSQAWWPEEGKYTALELPAMIVNPAQIINNTALSGSEYNSGEDWYLDLLVARFPKDFKIRDQTTWAKVRPFIRSVPNFFNIHRMLERNDGGLSSGITLPSVYAVAASSYEGALYASVGFRMTTFTTHSR